MCLTPIYIIIFLIIISIIFKNQIITISNTLSLYIIENPLLGTYIILGFLLYVILFLVLSNWEGVKETLNKNKKSS